MKDDRKLKRKVRNSYIISTISMSLVLFLLGSVGYLMAAAMKVADTLKESLSVSVELSRSLSEEECEGIAEKLSAMQIVRTVSYLSRDEKLQNEEFRQLFGNTIEEALGGENPLADSFELTLTELSADEKELDEFILYTKQLQGVTYVSYPKQMAEELHSTVSKIRLILFLFGGSLLFISLILVSNTIRLAIFSKRYLINTMKLVGATKWFIIRPFLWRSVGQGLGAALGAAALFAVMILGLNESVPELLTFATPLKIAVILASMFLLGVVISVCFTYLAVNKFINMTSNKIYLY